VFAADDRIFLGEGLFETLRVEQGEPCWADLHWQRLVNSAQQLGIPLDLSYEQWLGFLKKEIEQNQLVQGGIKVILSAGSAPRGLTNQGEGGQFMLNSFKYTVQTHPLTLVRAPWLRDSANPIYQIKSINYLEAIFARRHALALGADDALFFNGQQHATETTCANLFLIQQQTLFTPPKTEGVLPGITRSRILAFARNEGIGCMETSITQSMLEQADALFITNSLQGIRAIRALDGLSFAVDHPLMAHLNSLFSIFDSREATLQNQK
jgi:4-amino-4-deoxychorismate lyase